MKFVSEIFRLAVIISLGYMLESTLFCCIQVLPGEN